MVIHIFKFSRPTDNKTPTDNILNLHPLMSYSAWRIGKIFWNFQNLCDAKTSWV